MKYVKDIRFRLSELDLETLSFLMRGGTLNVPFVKHFRSTDPFSDETIEVMSKRPYRITEGMVTGYQDGNIFYEVKFAEFIEAIIDCPDAVKRRAIGNSAIQQGTNFRLDI